MKLVPLSAAPESAWIPMSTVPPSPAHVTTLMSFLFRYSNAAAIPDATDPPAANAMSK